VEVVAWSARSYALAVAFALGSLLAWFRHLARRAAFAASAPLLFAASLAARPLALGFPLMLVVLDVWLHRRTLRAGGCAHGRLRPSRLRQVV
jgi:hypothetical protein